MSKKRSDIDRSKIQQLPKEHIDWIMQPISRFFHIESASGVVLLLVTIIALALANSPLYEAFNHFWETPIGISAGAFEFERSLHGWINDALMTLFFFLIALELKREMVLGELNNPRLAVLSIAAAIGGMFVPVLIYLMFQWGQPGQEGWGTVMATDTAFVVGCLALLGTRIPKSLRIFMLSLAIVDDLGAIIVVTMGYGDHIEWIFVAFASLGFLSVRIMASVGVRSIALFFILGGGIWLAVDASGIHPTVTGVILGIMTPTTRWVSDDRLHAIMDSVVAHPPGDHWSGDTVDRKLLQTAEAAARETLSPLERLEMRLHPWVGFFVMPMFALANAGIPIELIDFRTSQATTVFVGLVFGKPIGILLFSWGAVRLGFAILPKDLSWRLILGGGLLAGIGFTMAMFIANLAFSQEHINTAKLGILSASVVAAILGMTVLRLSAQPKFVAVPD